MDPAHPFARSNATLTPLTHVGKDGPFKRTADVEAQLYRAVRLSTDALLARVRITDRGDPERLNEESLVYLIREANRGGNDGLVSALAEQLMGRCGHAIDARLRALGQDAADEGQSVVVTDLFTRILDLNSDRGDFLQARFWLALDSLISTAFRSQTRRLRRGRDEVPLSHMRGEERAHSDDGSADGGAVAVSPDHWTPTPHVDERWADHEVVRDALAGLPDRVRRAFVLKHYANWPIESKDPAVMTISRALNVSGRTIGSDLKIAEAHLHAWRERVHERT